jgi:hypothetical protein
MASTHSDFFQGQADRAYSIGGTRLSKQEEEEEEKSNFVEKDFANVQKL